MRTSLSAAALAALVLGSCCAQPAPKAVAVAEPTPPDPAVQLPPTVEEPPAVTKPFPATRRDDIVDTLHGQAVADPYRWLEDAEQPAVKAWMDAQDAFTRGELAKLPGRDAIAARLREVFYFDALGAPTHRKGRFFFSRKHADKEKTVVYWKQGAKGADQVLFDPNTWSADGSTGLGEWWPSKSGAYVAYAKKENNADESVTYVRDVASGKDLPDVIPGTECLQDVVTRMLRKTIDEETTRMESGLTVLASIGSTAPSRPARCGSQWWGSATWGFPWQWHLAKPTRSWDLISNRPVSPNCRPVARAQTWATMMARSKTSVARTELLPSC